MDVLWINLNFTSSIRKKQTRVMVKQLTINTFLKSTLGLHWINMVTFVNNIKHQSLIWLILFYIILFAMRCTRAKYIHIRHFGYYETKNVTIWLNTDLVSSHTYRLKKYTIHMWSMPRIVKHFIVCTTNNGHRKKTFPIVLSRYSNQVVCKKYTYVWPQCLLKSFRIFIVSEKNLLW